MIYTDPSKRLLIVLLICCIVPCCVSGQWTVINTGTSGVISDIQFADDNTVYATGDSVFLKSVDGGYKWTDLSAAITPITYPSFEGVHFLNKDTGFIYRVNVGSSRVDLQACKLEYSIVSPK